MTTEPSQPPDWVQAWQIALGCEVLGPPGLWMYRPVQPGPVKRVPNRDSPEYAWGLVLALTRSGYVQIGTDWAVVINKTGAYPQKGHPDPVSALIAAVLAGGGK